MKAAKKKKHVKSKIKIILSKQTHRRKKKERKKTTASLRENA